MAATADLVVQNFIWRIETISPTSTLSQRKFRHQDYAAFLSAEQSAGMTRAFTVRRVEGGAAAEPSDMYSRVADHLVELVVAYTTDFKPEERERLIAQDAHDLKKRLRDHTLWTGYDASNTSSDIGLWNRRLERESTDYANETTTYLRQTWRNTICETEV